MLSQAATESPSANAAPVHVFAGRLTGERT